MAKMYSTYGTFPLSLLLHTEISLVIFNPFTRIQEQFVDLGFVGKPDQSPTKIQR
jgi:hypothetical protein